MGIPPLFAISLMLLTDSLMISYRSTGSKLNFRVPVSILDISRRSVTSLFCLSILRSTIPNNSSLVRISFSDPESDLRTSIESFIDVSGVFSSCDAIETNSDFSRSSSFNLVFADSSSVFDFFKSSVVLSTSSPSSLFHLENIRTMLPPPARMITMTIAMNRICFL